MGTGLSPPQSGFLSAARGLAAAAPQRALALHKPRGLCACSLPAVSPGGERGRLEGLGV